MNIQREPVLQRLATIIQDSGYRTKTEFCEAMGISPQSLGNVQNPKNTNRGIPKSLMLGLAQHGYNLQWLLWGVGDKKN